MTHKLCLFLVGFSAWASVHAAQQFIETRGAVTYSSDVWSPSDPRHIVDVRAQPLGGSKAFASRLDYPESLRRQRVAGTVIVEVSLGAKGRVLSAELIQSVHPMLDAIVLRAVRQTQWQPATKSGKPVPYKFKIPITFRRRH